MWVVAVVLVLLVILLMTGGSGLSLNDRVGGELETVVGSFTCLPYKGVDTENADCVLGVKGDNGFFYGLDSRFIQDVNSDLKAQDTVAVTGFIIDAMKLEGADVATTTDWGKYDVTGVIKVNTLLRTR